MAYDTEILTKQAIEIARTFNCLFIEDVVAYLGINKQTFYNHQLDEIDELREIINKNRFNIKNSLRKKWAESDNATTQIVLYKLCSTDTELKLLNPAQRTENVNLNVDVTKELTQNEIESRYEQLMKVLTD